MKQYLYTSVLIVALMTPAFSQMTGPPGRSNSSQYPGAPGTATTPPTFPTDQSTSSDKDQDQNKGRDQDRDRDRDQDRDKKGKKVDKGKLQSKIHDAIRKEPELAKSDISVKVDKKDQVVLSGTVPTEREKAKAEQVAQSVAGNTVIINQINTTNVSSVSGANAGTTSGAATADRDQDRDKEKLRSKVHDAIRNEPELANSNISVKVDNNNQVVLTGMAPTERDKAKAEQVAQSVAGSTVIINQINTTNVSSVSGANAGTTSGAATTSGVAPSTGTSTSGMTTGASGISSASSSPGAPVMSPGSNVCIRVDNNNQVTLNGTVPTEQDKQKAEQIAQSMTGNSTIINQINTTNVSNVSGAGGSTTAATGATTTGTTSGTTSGTTPSTTGATSSATTGTSSGRTSLGGGPEPATADFKSQIESTLHQEAGLSDVHVNVTDSKVELFGTVPTGKEKQTAKRIAESTAGGREVVNNLTVTGRGNKR